MAPYRLLTILFVVSGVLNGCAELPEVKAPPVDAMKYPHTCLEYRESNEPGMIDKVEYPCAFERMAKDAVAE